jgi:hypothetical protein
MSAKLNHRESEADDENPNKIFAAFAVILGK